MHEPMMGIGGWVGFILMIVFWTLLIFALALWIKSLLRQAGTGSAPREPESALEILKKRYARGEINKQEFEEKRKDLL
jgi:putative membrane protein